MKLRGAISNALDEKVIDNKLNADEEIIGIVEFINDFISSLSERFRNRIIFETPFEPENLPRLKVDRLILLDAMRKIFAGLFKTDAEGIVNVSVMMDHLDQLIIIFYLKSQTQNINIKPNSD